MQRQRGPNVVLRAPFLRALDREATVRNPVPVIEAERARRLLRE
jgi:hypothetical protein